MQAAGEITVSDLRAFSWFFFDRGRKTRALPRFFQPVTRVVAFVLGVAVLATLVRWLVPSSDDAVSRAFTTMLSVLLVLVWSLMALYVVLMGLLIGLMPLVLAKQPRRARPSNRRLGER